MQHTMLTKILPGMSDITRSHKRHQNVSLDVFAPLETAIKFMIRFAVSRYYRTAGDGPSSKEVATALTFFLLNPVRFLSPLATTMTA